MFGYSAGGGLAFEVAKQMEAQGHEVSDIIILDAFSIKHVWRIQGIHTCEKSRVIQPNATLQDLDCYYEPGFENLSGKTTCKDS